jgi:hypothetical protein
LVSYSGAGPGLRELKTAGIETTGASRVRLDKKASAEARRSACRSEADVFDGWPSSDAFERRSFCQRRGPFLLRGVLKPIPYAASDFVVAAARAPNNVTIEILWGEVSGFAGTH